MDTPTGNRLAVPGANLYYEVRGAGRLLLLIAGGSADAGVYEPMAARLARDYTVVTYDPRGNSRSPLDRPWKDQRIEVHSDDARRLLDLLSTEPAEVFGSSSGAIVGLDLIARHPEQVRTLIAHEPPAVQVLPDAAEQRAFFDEVYDTYRRVGVDAAMQRFAAGIGVGDQAPPRQAQLPPSMVEMLSRVSANNEFFLAHEVRPFTRFVPDVPALQAGAGRIVLAGGRDSRASLPYRPAVAVADRLGSHVVDFPGGHAGYMTHPAEFATQLTDVLTIRSESGRR
jgi:pimeloyl-ACP methyl ester carboxylesterase